MPKPRATKTKAPTPIPSSEVPAPKIRRTNAFKLEIPSLPLISGNLLVCGQNDVGQLGLDLDEVSEKLRPALVPDVKNVVNCKAGGMHSLCLTRAGEVWTFGCNDEGALGRPTEDEEGSEAIPRKIELPGKVVKISAGDSHSACLLENGKVFAWGSFRDSHGNMGLTIEGNKRNPIEVVAGLVAVDIASGNDHLVILAEDGSVYTIGCAEQGQLGRVSGRSLDGESRRGKTALLTPGVIKRKAQNFKANAIWATPFCVFMRERSKGDIYAFGLNNYNQLGVPKHDGKEIEHHPVLSEFTNVKSISGGQHHTIVLTNDNKVFAIGRKDYGRLGLGAVEEDVQRLTHVGALEDKEIVSITCGDSNTFALSKKGEVYVWGIGTSNQLGTGDDADVITPTTLTGAQVKDKNVIAVSSGGQHSMFVVEVSEPKDSKAEKPKQKVIASNEKDESPEVPTNGDAEAEKNPTDLNGNTEKVAAVESNKRGKKRKA